MVRVLPAAGAAVHVCTWYSCPSSSKQFGKLSARACCVEWAGQAAHRGDGCGPKQERELVVAEVHRPREVGGVEKEERARVERKREDEYPIPANAVHTYHTTAETWREKRS